MDSPTAPLQARKLLCVVNTLANCASQVKTRCRVTDMALDLAIASWSKTDVSGNAVRSATTVIAKFQQPCDKASHRYRFPTLHLRANSVVDNVSLSFDYGDPGKASTMVEYDQSGLFDILSPLLPDSCMGRDKIALYRFFNESVKPTIEGPSGDTYSSVYSTGDQYQY